MTAEADTARAFGARNRTTFRPSRVLLGALGLVVLWELVALRFSRTLEHPEFVMPELTYVLRVGLPGLSDYYSGVFGGTPPGLGGSHSVWMGMAAIAEHAAISVWRVGAGLVVGTAIGVAGGIVMAALRPVRLATFGVANLARMLPLLALGPLFTLWFGPTTTSSIIFVAFATALTMLVATLTAVRNLDPDLLAYPRTLGLGNFTVYWRVALPAIVPELAASLTICGPLAWSVLLASELYGTQEGLGWMMGEALDFTLVDRITVIAATFIVLNFVTLKVMQALVARATRWAE